MAKFILSAFADEAADSLCEQIEALKENGICYIEPRSIDGKNLIDLTDGELLSVRKKLDERDIKVGSLGSPIGKYGINEPFSPYLEKFKRAIKVCNILGTDKMRMFSFFVRQEELKEKRAEVIARLEIMTEIARESGITLCHENESEIYGQMPSEVSDLLTSLPDMKGIFDPANYRMNGADALLGLEATLINLGYLHIKDAVFSEQMILPAGEGEGKIPEALLRVDSHTDDIVMLTVEPHLFSFTAYSSIDKRELKGRYHFKNRRESFSFAVNSLKNILKKLGFTESEDRIWTR